MSNPSLGLLPHSPSLGPGEPKLGGPSCQLAAPTSPIFGNPVLQCLNSHPGPMGQLNSEWSHCESRPRAAVAPGQHTWLSCRCPPRP